MDDKLKRNCRTIIALCLYVQNILKYPGHGTKNNHCGEHAKQWEYDQWSIKEII